jgi:hypothetical protein
VNGVIVVFMVQPLCRERGSLSQRYFDPQRRRLTLFYLVSAQRSLALILEMP